MKTLLLTGTLCVLGASACSFAARAPETYKQDTRALLETRNSSIKSCYDTALKENKDLSGKVIVHFVVEADTGQIKDATPLPESTAPDNLSNCIVNAINGLVLEPPDANNGDATFTWEFQAG